MKLQSTALSLTLAGLALAAAPKQAQAEDCYILVHGHNPDGTAGLMRAGLSQATWPATGAAYAARESTIINVRRTGSSYGFRGTDPRPLPDSLVVLNVVARIPLLTHRRCKWRSSGRSVELRGRPTSDTVGPFVLAIESS